MGMMVFIFTLLFSSWLHPVHVSLLNIDMETNTGDFTLTFKMFSDDFESIISQKYGIQLDIVNQVDPEENILSVNKYIDESFSMSINGMRIEALEYIRNELNHEAIWLFYRGRFEGTIRTVTITNKVMMDKFEDQTNLVIVTYLNKQNGYRLNNKNPDITFKIE